MFTGKTGNLGVIGWPIAHSLSPAMQNAALEMAGLDYVYVALPVVPEALTVAVNGLKAVGFRGFNVTLPHKQAVLAALDELDEDAGTIGAVNTVVNEDGRLIGYNTDVVGSMDALKGVGFEPKKKDVVLLGSGGVARALLWGLVKELAARVTIGARHPEKAEAMLRDFRSKTSLRDTDINAYHWDSRELRQAFHGADLVINATSLGMTPFTEVMPPVDWREAKEGALAYDVIYTPAQTKFLRRAEEAGHPTLNGEEMLVRQGAASFRLWTHVEPNMERMKEVLREELAAQE